MRCQHMLGGVPCNAMLGTVDGGIYRYRRGRFSLTVSGGAAEIVCSKCGGKTVVVQGQQEPGAPQRHSRG